MRDGLSWIERRLRVLEAGAMGVAVVSLALTSIVVVVDVAARYGLNSPLRWSYPLISNDLLVLIYFFALGETHRRRENVRVELLDRHLGDRAAALLSGAIALLVLVFAVLLVIVSYDLLAESIRRNEVIPGVIRWPRWPTYAAFFVGSVLFTLRVLSDVAAAAAGSLGLGPMTRGASHSAEIE